MYKLNFKSFMDGEYPDEYDFTDLYVLRDGDNVLYVGISRRGIWNRWFDGWSSHMIRNIYGDWFGGSTAGRAVTENMPASMGWTIELWTMEDLHERLDCKHSLERMEKRMIDELRPTLNTLSVYYRTKTNLSKDREEDMQKAHREIFS